MLFTKKNIFVSVMVVLLIVGLAGVADGLTLFNTVPALESEEHYLGDVNADGEINVGDAINILRHVVGLTTLNEIDNWQRADVNLDGNVNVSDAILILRYIVNLIDRFTPVDPATVSTEKALVYALGCDEVNILNLARDIVLSEPLSVSRDVNINGEGGDEDFAINGEVIVTAEVESFTAQNIKIETLTLNGGGQEFVHLNDAIIDELNVNDDVSIDLEGDTQVGQANFNSNANVSGGNRIQNAWIGKGIEVDFGEEPPMQTFTSVTKIITHETLNIENADGTLESGDVTVATVAAKADSIIITSIGEGATTITAESDNGKEATVDIDVSSDGSFTVNVKPYTAEPAEKTATPVITTESQTVSTATIIIEGTAEASSAITISGGAAVAEGEADADGSFNIVVTLTADAVNTLNVKAKSAGKTVSDAATVEITHETEVPVQQTATPVITTESQTVSTATIIIEGTAEASSAIKVIGGASEATGEADAEGNFSIEVTLTPNAVNNLSVTAQAVGKTVSDAAMVEITHVTIRLSITEQPSQMTAGDVITPAPVVQFFDANDDILKKQGVEVTVSLNDGEFASGTLTVTTDEEGAATFDDLVIEVAGTHTLTFEAGGFDSVTSEEFDVLPASFDPLKSGVVRTSDAIVTASDSINAVLLLSIKDEYGNPISGEYLVTVATENIGMVVFDKNGEFTLELSIEEAKEYTDIPVTVDEKIIGTVDVTVIAAGADAGESTVERISDEIVPAGADNIVLDLSIADKFKNPISGEYTVIVGDWYDGALSFDNNGEATLTFSATNAGIYPEIPVAVDESEIGSIAVTVEALGVDGSKSLAELAHGENVKAGQDNIHLTLTIKDEYSNPVSGNFSVVIGSWYNDDVAFDDNGEANLTLTETALGEYNNVTVTVDNILIGDFSVTVNPGVPEYLSVSAEPGSIVISIEAIEDGSGNSITLEQAINFYGLSLPHSYVELFFGGAAGAVQVNLDHEAFEIDSEGEIITVNTDHEVFSDLLPADFNGNEFIKVFLADDNNEWDIADEVTALNEFAVSIAKIIIESAAAQGAFDDVQSGTNIVSIAQAIINEHVGGVTVLLESSDNQEVINQETGNPGDAAKTGTSDVIFKLTKSTETLTETLLIKVVPARVNNIDELKQALNNSIISSILLTDDIDLNGQNIISMSREATVDGGEAKHKISGGGSLTINHSGDFDLTFKNIEFKSEPNDAGSLSLDIVGGGLAVSFEDVIVTGDYPGTVFCQAWGLQNITVTGSVFDMNALAAFMHDGDEVNIENNTFIGQFIYAIGAQNQSNINMIVKNNDFLGVTERWLLNLHMNHGNNGIVTVNGETLAPGPAGDLSFKDEVNDIHHSIYVENDVTENYKTSYLGSDNIRIVRTLLSTANVTATVNEAGEFTAIVTNHDGTRMAGESVQITDDGGLGGINVNDTADTDVNGIATFMFNEETVGVYSVKISLDGDVTETLTVTVEAAGVNAGESGVERTSEATVAADEDNVTLTLTIADEYGNPISKTLNVVVGTGEDIWHNAPVVFTGGEATLTFAITEAGVHENIPVAVDGIGIGVFNVTVEAAGVNGEDSDVERTSDATVTAGVEDNVTLTLTIADEYDNPISDTFNVIVGSGDYIWYNSENGDDSIEFVDGDATLDVTVTKAGLLTDIPVSVNGEQIGAFGVNVDAAGVHGDNSGVVLTPDEAVTAGDNNITLTLTIADEYGNPIDDTFNVIVEKGEDTWYDSVGDDEQVVFVNGHGTVTVTETAAGDYTDIASSVDGVEIGTFNVTVEPAPPSLLNISAEPGSIVVNIDAIDDEYGNPITFTQAFEDYDLNLAPSYVELYDGVSTIKLHLDNGEAFTIDFVGETITVNIDSPAFGGFDPTQFNGTEEIRLYLTNVGNSSEEWTIQDEVTNLDNIAVAIAKLKLEELAPQFGVFNNLLLGDNISTLANDFITEHIVAGVTATITECSEEIFDATGGDGTAIKPGTSNVTFTLTKDSEEAVAIIQATVLPPTVQVIPDFEMISGDRWPLEAEVNLYINDGFIATETTDGEGIFEFMGVASNPGDTVIVTCGEVTLEYVVKAVAVNAPDGSPGITSVSGTAEEDGHLEVVVFPGGATPQINVDGLNWEADFSELVYINDASEVLILVILEDDDGNATITFWGNPLILLLEQTFYDGDFQVIPQLNLIIGDEWEPHSGINIKIFGDGFEPHEINTVTDAEGGFMVDTEHEDWPEGFQIEQGHIVRVLIEIEDPEEPAEFVKIIEVQDVTIDFDGSTIELTDVPEVQLVGVLAVRFVDDKFVGMVVADEYGSPVIVEEDGEGNWLLDTEPYEEFPPDDPSEVIILVFLIDDDMDTTIIIGGNLVLIPLLLNLMMG